MIDPATFGGDFGFDSFVKGSAGYHAVMKPQIQPGARPVNTFSHARRGRNHSMGGFTMIELMITVAIVAILTSIAYPAYRNYVLRGQVTYATNALSSTSANMERWFQDNRTYVGGPCTPPAVNYGPSSTTYFAVSCPTTLTATTFTISAVGYGSVAGFTYTIDQAGNQTTTVIAPAPSAWYTGTAGCPGTSSWETKAGTC